MNRDNFKWTDELVAKYCDVFRYSTPANLQEFKASHSIGNEEWEIECIQHGNRNYWRQKDGKYTNQPFDGGNSSEWLLKNGGIIFQVTRKSDGVVFTVGDDVYRGGGDTGKIQKFKVSNFWIGGMAVGFNGGVERNGTSIKSIQPLPQRTKPPLGPLSREVEKLEERIAYIEKKLNIEG